MCDIRVQKIAEGKGTPLPWIDKPLAFSDQVRHKAFELFEESGRLHGHELNHWLEAERQLLSVPGYELLETADAIDIRTAISRFHADEIGIVALPDSLMVKADSNPGHEKREGRVCNSEFNDHELLRRIPLPTWIDVTRVTASVDKGILSIAAPAVATEAESSCGSCQACRAVKGAVQR
jgi:HSP20 family molecular chaperone IbpA